MINIIWVVMLLISIVVFVLRGDVNGITSTMAYSAENSIGLLISLAGIMAIWSGFMRICEKSGMVGAISRIMSPLLKSLFPGLVGRSPQAMGNIIMNISTNMMGLSNAATPFGVKAMEELQKINPDKEKASDHMVTFLIINAACIQILPTTVISIMAGLKSRNPTAIIIPGMIATAVALAAGLVSSALLKRFFK